MFALVLGVAVGGEVVVEAVGLQPEGIAGWVVLLVWKFNSLFLKLKAAFIAKSRVDCFN